VREARLKGPVPVLVGGLRMHLKFTRNGNVYLTTHGKDVKVMGGASDSQYVAVIIDDINATSATCGRPRIALEG
jgi:hypothetical protein